MAGNDCGIEKAMSKEPKRKITKRQLLQFITLGILVLAIAAALIVPRVARKMESTKCTRQMSSIGFAANLWAGDYDDRLPMNLGSMSNELNTTTMLICPGDHSRKAATNWSSVGPATSSYELLTPGAAN